MIPNSYVALYSCSLRLVAVQHWGVCVCVWLVDGFKQPHLARCQAALALGPG